MNLTHEYLRKLSQPILVLGYEFFQNLCKLSFKQYESGEMVAQLVKSFHCKQGPKFEPHNPCTKARHGGPCILIAGKVERGRALRPSGFQPSKKAWLKNRWTGPRNDFEVVLWPLHTSRHTHSCTHTYVAYAWIKLSVMHVPVVLLGRPRFKSLRYILATKQGTISLKKSGGAVRWIRC